MAIYKRGREFQLGTSEEQIQQVARTGLEPTAGLQVQRAEHLATLPPALSRSLHVKDLEFAAFVVRVSREYDLI